ncbi:MAG: glycosyltransferase family 4 protein [Planctomycetes bacterium]|nr:glycosyltransferase family 4 protein [Planctomycetota bacterium]
MREPTNRPLFSLHVDAEKGFSGGEVQVFLLLEGLRARGQRVALAAPPGSMALAEAGKRGIECVPVRLTNDLDLPSALALRRELVRLRPDLVHLHTGRATWLGGHAARWARVPAVSTRRMDRRVKRNASTRWLYTKLIARVVAISGPVRELLLSGGIDPARIEVIHSAVDPQALVPRRARGELRAELGAQPQDFVLLVLASLVPRKGVDVLLEALAPLAERSIRPAVWIAGEGVERHALEALARAKGLEHVRFLGRREDAAELLGACDALVLPARREGLGVAALQAMAAGRPVVASAVGGLAEAVRDRECGLLVPSEDPARLAGAIEELYKDPALCARLSAGGRARVAQGYLASQMVAAYDELYRRVLAEVAPR